jgi:2-polyprenyl-6-methoxyphenol hydroxylase-like FAD-dependent oxidoreductase
MTFDVVVAGGGPVGLTLAAELRLGGVSVLVVERRTEIDRTIKAGSIALPAAQALARRGLADALGEVQRGILQAMLAKPGETPPGERELTEIRRRGRRIGGHFSGLFKLDPSRVDPADPDFRLHEDAVHSLIPQRQLEEILGEFAASVGVEVRRGQEVRGFDQDGEGVTVTLADGSELRAAYLVGCDGGRSAVRKLAGFDFPGTDGEITGRQAMVELDDGDELPIGWNRVPGGMLVAGPGPNRVLTVEFGGRPADRGGEVTAEEIQGSLRRLSGTDVTVRKVLSATRWTDNARQASTYRKGRVLLAGDAAHVHSPFGGQGINLGIGDAVNLGWKLAATIRGWAPEGLLDTYTAERHPIGARVLDITRAQVALMRPDPLTSALRQVVSELMDTDDGNAYFVKMISGVTQRYPAGDGHPLVGKLTPDLEFEDGTWIGERFPEGKSVLFDFSGQDVLPSFAAGHPDRLAVVSLPLKEKGPLAALLVRPDGHVAWAAEAPGDTTGLDAALTRWLGEPSVVAAGR